MTYRESNVWDGRLDRRTMLRGLGAAMALPYLEAMGPLRGLSSVASAAGAPLSAGASPMRLAFVFTPNGVNYDNWMPKGEGREFELSPALQPLAKVRDHINVLTGLTLDKARANGDGPGDHARSSSTFLTGRQARKTAGNDIQIGVSVDQFAAAQVGEHTRLPSLELGCEHGQRAGSCDSGYACAYSANISWRDEDTPVPKLVDPGLAFERLFGDAAAAGRQAERLRRRRSVLDYLREDTRQLEGRLGTADRRKLDEFQTAVREIERRVQLAQEQTDSRELPSGTVAPPGVPPTATEHIDLMYDMLRLAFMTDTTRVASFMHGTGGSNRTFPEIGIKEGHHHLSHHRGNEDMVDKIRRIDRFYMERFARFIGSLADTPEGEGTLLDNCLVMLGSGISDGNRHNHEDLPIVLAGRGGGAIETGRRVAFGRETPLCNLYVSLLERAGCEVESFGDSTGGVSL